MSRHRIIRKLNIEEELAEDDDADYIGRSLDDDEPLTPGTSQYLYRRPTTHAIPEERTQIIDHYSANDNSEYEDLEVFDIDVIPQSKPKRETLHNSADRTGMFQIGEPKSKTKQQKNKKSVAVPPSVENLRISESKPARGNSKSPARMTPNSSFQRLSALDAALAATTTTTTAQKPQMRPAPMLNSINLVIVGHVDAGKSTLVGHLLYLLGSVDDRVMHKNRQESFRAGKASFAFAWLLDEAEEERQRGVTMDIARVSFQSPLRDDRVYNVLDAPGHKDFIPNMITGMKAKSIFRNSSNGRVLFNRTLGASQADAALLVINATRGEFETGFDQGGQTREHALLLRSLGVVKIVVAVNKLDTFDWSRARFDEVCASLRLFLEKQAGFENVKFVPVSGLIGTNLVERPASDHPLSQWYADGPSLLEALDQIPSPNRAKDEPLRIVVNDVLRLTTNTLNVAAKVEAGHVESGDKLFLMPEANPVIVKSVNYDDVSGAGLRQSQQQSVIGYSGDQILLTVTGAFEPDSIYSGHVLCHGGSELLVPLKRFLARIVVFDIRIPILKGTRAELFAHSTRVPCVIIQLRSVLNKTTHNTLKNNPRVLTRNMSALVEIETEAPVNIEPHPKTLCRFTLRANNQTICAGVVDKAL